jgi:hypothetical protein
VDGCTRQGVLEALAARRFFASRIKGLRVDAALTSTPGGSSSPARMGTALAHAGGRALVQIDLDRGEAWWGRPLSVQVLRPGRPMPTLAATVEAPLPRPDEPVIAFEVDLDPTDGDWVVLRVSDPGEPPDTRAAGQWAQLGRGIAYTSPFWLDRPGRPDQGR